MIDEKDEFWQILANPPGYDLSPWKGMDGGERKHLLLILNWVLNTPKLLIDVYEMLNDTKQHKDFKHYLSGDHVLNFHLLNDLNFPKPLAYKTIDIHFDFSHKFPVAAHLGKDQLQSLVNQTEVNVAKVCNGWFRNHPEFFAHVDECSGYVESFAYQLGEVVKKHETFIRAKLEMMKLTLIRITVLRDSDVPSLPMKKTTFRVGIELNNEATDSVFFWSLFTLRVDWKEALLGESFETENVTVINIMPKNSDPPITSLMIKNLSIISFKACTNQLNTFKDRVLVNEKHFDSIFSNPNCSFLKKRHDMLADLFAWCKDNKIDIEQLEDKLADMSNVVSEVRKEKLGFSDFWYLEFQDFCYDADEKMITFRKERKQTEFSLTDWDKTELTRKTTKKDKLPKPTKIEEVSIQRINIEIPEERKTKEVVIEKVKSEKVVRTEEPQETEDVESSGIEWESDDEETMKKHIALVTVEKVWFTFLAKIKNIFLHVQNSAIYIKLFGIT